MLKSYFIHRAAKLHYRMLSQLAENFIPYYMLYCNLQNNGVFMNPDKYIDMIVEGNDLVNEGIEEKKINILKLRFRGLVTDMAQQNMLMHFPAINELEV